MARRAVAKLGPSVLVAGLAALASLVTSACTSRAPSQGAGLVNPGTILLGRAVEVPIGVPQVNNEGRFWLVRLDDDRFVALSWKDPHLGCTVPWRADFTFGKVKGWFRNPCHGETYDLAGQCYFGPCVRGLDRYPVSIVQGRLFVNTRIVEQGPPVRAGSCLPSYPDACLGPQGDFVCSETERDMRVIRPDPLGLDPDGDGRACENS